VLSSDIKEAFFVAQTLSSQHVCNRGGFFCLPISSHSRIMRASLRGMNSHDLGGASTNDLGEFRIPDLRAGRYTITANPSQGFRAPHAKEKGTGKENLVYTTTYYPGTLDKQQAVAVESTRGTKLQLILEFSPARVTALRVRWQQSRVGPS